jgi:hypothetical protein
MTLDPKSRAYGPTYKPTKSLEQLVAENPGNQFLADREEAQARIVADAADTEKKR